MSDEETKPKGWQRVSGVIKHEVQGLHPRLHVFGMAAAFLPRRASGTARAAMLRLVGFSLGEGTVVEGTPKITGGKGLFDRLVVGKNCVIDTDCVLDLEERITLGDSVTVGPGVMILTSTHELATSQHRAGPVTRAPVNVGEGAWLRARFIILPGVTVGAGSIVEAGAVVNKDVAPNTRVGGIPAAQLEVLEEKRGTKLKLGLGLFGVTLVALIGPLAERFFGRTRLRFNYLCTPMSDARYAELGSKPGWSQSRLTVAPGLRLRGLLRKPTTPGAPWILFYPGNDESQLTMGQTFLSRLAGDKDWGLGVYAYRGYDSSDGTPDVATLAVDAPAILDRFCVTQGVSASNVHLVGFSIGGYFAAQASRGASEARRSAATLTLMASVDDIVMVRKSPWSKLSAGDDYQTRPVLTGVLGPVLVLQGTADEALAGPGQGRAIAAALGDRGTYHELAGVSHEGLLQDPAALDKVRDFVSENSRPAR